MRAFFAEGQFETDGGERLTLVCDFQTIDVVESVTGENWDDILPQLIKPPKSLAVKVLYGLLRKRHEGITLDEAAALFYDQNSIALWAVMGDVIARACNFGDGGEDQPAKKKRGGRSPSSAKSG